MPEVAAFDFDRTLTRRDTFVPFLRLVRGRRGLAVDSWAALRRSRPGTLTRDTLKADLCRAALRGRTRDDLAALGARHAGDVLRTGMRPDTLARLRWHQAEGHRVVVVSAGLDTYLTEVVARLGVDGLVCTTVAFDDHGVATGELSGGNCRGPAKAERLTATWAGQPRPERVWAYGDSAGDRELLAMSDHSTTIGRRRIAARG